MSKKHQLLLESIQINKVEKGTKAEKTHYKTSTTKTSTYDEHYIPREGQNPELLHRRRCTRCTTICIRRKARRPKSSMKPTEYT
eukprot:1866624-Amphidinium_carterae.1